MTSQPEWVGYFENLRTEGEQLERRAEQSLITIIDLIGTPGSGAVSARFDAEGLLEVLEFDDELRTGLEPEKVVEEINAALSRAAMALGSPLLPMSPAGTRENPMESQPFRRMIAMLDAGIPLEPETFTNDFGQVSVSALSGNISRVDCKASWIASTPDRLIAEEVVRMARIAARATDTFERFTKED